MNNPALQIILDGIDKQDGRSVGEKQKFFQTPNAYRGLEGRKCFVGMLISDEDFNPEWDIKYTAAVDLPQEVLDKLIPGFNGHQRFNSVLQLLQGEHDISPLEWDDTTKLRLKNGVTNIFALLDT